MASGTINLTQSATSGSYIDGKIVWSASADNDANVSKNVTAKLYVRKDNTDTALTVATQGTWKYSLTINGSTASGSVQKSVLTDWVLVATKTIGSISHNSDGTKSITISGSVTAPTETNFEGHVTSGSGTAKLDTIPRASTITSVAAVTLGNKCSLKWTPASASFRYKLKFALGSWSYTTEAIHPNKTTAYTYTGYTIPLDVAEQLTSTISGTMTVTLYTYSNSAATAQVGEANSAAFVVTVPNNSSTKPTVTLTVSPVHSLPTAFNGLFVQGKSKVKGTISATGKYGASMRSYSMKVGGTSYGSSSSYTSGYLASYGSSIVYGYATDSRGFTGSTAKSISVIAYSKPKILPVSGQSKVVAARCDSNGNLSDSGTYLKIKAKRSYSPVMSGGEQHNFCTIRYRYRAVGASSFSAWTTILAGTTLASDVADTNPLLNGALAVNTSYEVQVGVVDSVGESAYTSITIPTDKVFLHRDGALGSFALGKYAESPGFEVAQDWPSHFHGDVYGRVLGLGKLPTIPDYANLNDYRSFGVFSVAKSATAKTLVNCPSGLAGTLRVWSSNGSGIGGSYVYIMQEYINYDNSGTYRRSIESGADGTWTYGSWKTVADYVEGETGIWRWRKYSDGTAECWGRAKNTSKDISTEFGGLYYGNCDEVTFPFSFYTAPVVTATVESGSALILMSWQGTDGNGTTTATKPASFRVVRPTSSTGVSFTIAYHAIGRWKE